MAAYIRNVTFDCADPERLADFWGPRLGSPNGTRRKKRCCSRTQRGASLVCRSSMPEAKAVKNRVHLDITAERLDVEVERLRELGATVLKIVEREDFAWVVMQDPESNEFCVTATGD
jgi:predicted enzyme related to lactoylglutathione lyase